jgi:CSLREA domain-containing protein
MALAAATGTSAKVFKVTSNHDPGHGACTASECTLREAIEAANARTGQDQIRFKLGRGQATIQPGSPLPALADVVTVDGWSQPGFHRRPLIELNGSAAGGGASGLVISNQADTTIIRGLVINRFAAAGVDVGGPGESGRAVIQGTYVGTDVKGKKDRGNGGAGVIVRALAGADLGGGAAKQRILLSGNGANGLQIEQSDVGGFPSSVVGSRIGTNSAGKAAIANDGDGINWVNASGAQIGGPNAGQGENENNLVSGNAGAGIVLDGNCLPICGAENVIDGNFVGTNASLTSAIANADAGIVLDGAGGTIIGDQVGNAVAGNGADGILIQGVAGATVQGNGIGLNGTLTGTIPNAGDGIDLNASPGTVKVGGASNSETNVIGGNTGNGIRVGGSNAEIYNNLIGVFPGRTNLGNGGDGVRLDGDALVGGTAPGVQRGNEIAFNGGAGVGASAGVSGISANSIHDNTGLGIDLGEDGTTANDHLDPDTGPNFLQNRPEITSVISTGSSTDVAVDLNSVAGAPTHPFRIELFSNSEGSCDPAGGEGAAYLAAQSLSTDGTGYGTASFSLPPIAAGTELSATATDDSDVFPWTSEFSACYSVPSS